MEKFLLEKFPKNDKEKAEELYNALTNRVWYNVEENVYYNTSFRWADRIAEKLYEWNEENKNDEAFIHL